MPAVMRRAARRSGSPVAGEREVCGARGLHGLKRMALIAPILIILIRCRDDAREVGVLLEDQHDARRIRKRKRAQQHSVHDSENRGIRADSEREGQNGDGRKTRVLGENAEAVSQILQQSAHQFPSPTPQPCQKPRLLIAQRG